MDLKNARAILAANHDILEGSFMYALHERGVFSRKKFWSLYSAMIIIAETQPRSRGRTVRGQAFWLYRNIVMSFLWHFDPRDAARIKRMPKILPGYIDRIEWVFHPVINGKRGFGAAPDFSDDLVNPQQAELDRYFNERARER